jgi:hypothetical protein
MNRPLKFRVWDKNQNKFLDPFRYEHNDYYKTSGLMVLDFYGKIRIADFSMGNGDNSADSVFSELENSSRYITQQYTGCHDAYNKEIYEGDIIEYNHGNGIRIGYVGFAAGIFFLNYTDETDDELGYLLVSNIKIIGNIFEDPELIK